MRYSIFLQLEFFLLIAFSVVVPAGVFWVMLAQRAISRTAVLCLGLVLIAVAGVDVALLRLLARPVGGPTTEAAGDRPRACPP